VDTVIATLGVLTYAASLLGVWSLARRVERTAQERLRTRPVYVCSCTHAFGLHVDGRCTGKTREPKGWDYGGVEITWHLVSCTCRCYAGDVPPEYVLGNFPQQLNVGDDLAGDDPDRAGGGTRHRW
jgi:hypothetical protein